MTPVLERVADQHRTHGDEAEQGESAHALMTRGWAAVEVENRKSSTPFLKSPAPYDRRNDRDGAAERRDSPQGRRRQ